MKLVLAAIVRIRQGRSMQNDVRQRCSMSGNGRNRAVAGFVVGEVESDPRREAERIRALLRATVEASGLSRRAVARGAEMSGGELDRVLREEGDELTLGQLHRILGAVDVTPESFFAWAYRPEER